MSIQPDLCNGTDQHFGSYKVICSNEFESGHICYFAGHTPFWGFPEYVYNYLKEIAAAGFGIIFISSSPIGAASLERLQNICPVIIEKENKGADFGAWKIGLSLTGYGKAFTTILLTNDSIFGPFFDLKPVFQAFRSGGSDFYGLTRSLQRDEHIQSYFIFIDNKVLVSEVWKEFWDNLLCYPKKDDIIDNYEIFFTKQLRSAGFHYDVWSDWKELAVREPIRKKIFKNANLFHFWGDALLTGKERFVENINPCAFYWQELITFLNFPFIKRELIINKKLNVEYDVLKNWKNAVAATGYETGFISQVLSLSEIRDTISSFPFNSPKFEFHYYYDPASPHFMNFILSFEKKTSLERGARDCLTITDTGSGAMLIFNLIYLTEASVDSLIEDNLHSDLILPVPGKNGYNLILPFSDDVIPYLQSRSSPRTAIFRGLDGYESAMLRYIRQVMPAGSEDWNDIYTPAAGKDLVDISDLKNIATLSGDPATTSNGEPEPFFELLKRYHREYESLPIWYKKIGQVFKIMSGHKVVKIKLKDKALKISLKHKVTVSGTNRANYIRNWYYHEYDVLPGWYKRLGKMINKNK
jgi:hypothetical protein